MGASTLHSHWFGSSCSRKTLSMWTPTRPATGVCLFSNQPSLLEYGKITHPCYFSWVHLAQGHKPVSCPGAEPSPCPVSFYPQLKSVWGVTGKATAHADAEAGKEVLVSPSSRCAPSRQEALGGEGTRTHGRRPSFPPASRLPHCLDDVPLLLSTPIFRVDMAGERRAQFGLTVEGNRAIYLS